jgi:parallel beta-helix repeat protein
MTLNEARKILGLKEEEGAQLHMEKFAIAREHMAKMVGTAPNEALAERYRHGLNEFDEALNLVRQHLDAAGLLPPPLPQEILSQRKTVAPPPAKTVRLGNAPAQPKAAITDFISKETVTSSDTRGRGTSYAAWFLILLLGAGAGAWFYLENEKSEQEQKLKSITALEREGSTFVENRRWQEAADAFEQIEKISPHSEIAQRGRRSIETGKGEEQTQFIGYWTGQAIAELEAGRLDEATAAARQVLEKYPQEKEASALMEKISGARAGQARAAALAGARSALDQRKWSSAISSAKSLLSAAPGDAEAQSILADATAAQKKAADDEAKALDLLKKAKARDSGQFDQQALDWMREANSLAPENAEIASLLEKLSSYTRTLRVPDDFATPEEALASARNRDRIVIGPSIWKGPLVVNIAVELQGAGVADTIIECRPEDGSAITIGPGAKGARVSGITFRHETFAVGTDRFSAVLVRGGIASFVDCRFTDASGHGLAVIESGQATVTRSRFAGNGWDGVAAIGKGTTLEVRDCESLNNFEHGIETWNGAAATLVNNRCEGNSRNGIHADNGTASATIEGNQLIANREFGVVVDSAASGKVSGNTARANLLGGIVIRSAADKLSVTTNQATLNQGPGLVLEKGLQPSNYTTNSVTQNVGEQVIAGVDLSENAPAVPAEEVIPRANIVPEEPK